MIACTVFLLTFLLPDELPDPLRRTQTWRLKGKYKTVPGTRKPTKGQPSGGTTVKGLSHVIKPAFCGATSKGVERHEVGPPPTYGALMPTPISAGMTDAEEACNLTTHVPLAPTKFVELMARKLV